MRRYAKAIQTRPPERMGRPPRLSHADEWELYCYRKSGIAIKTCASMFRVSVPTANRIIAKFREYDEVTRPAWTEFKEKMKAIRDSIGSIAAKQEVANG